MTAVQPGAATRDEHIGGDRVAEEARAAFEQEASAYWGSIADKRRGRNAKRRDRQSIGLDDYVLTQPPVYAGPKRPVDPQPSPAEPDETPRPRKTIPVVADLLKAVEQGAPSRVTFETPRVTLWGFATESR